MQVLPNRAILAVEGEEAGKFLHNLVTADVLGLAAGEARYAALLTPQGKILFDFFVVGTAEGFLLDCALSQRDELAKRLTFYKLRARLSIVSRDELEIGVSPDKPEMQIAYGDPRLADMGWRMIVPKGSLVPGSGYDTARIALGLADSVADLGSGIVFPHEANLDQLGGVNFAKGCYVGQEVVSRIAHRATARSRILPVKFASTAPAPGAEIHSGGKIIGTVLSSESDSALALIRLDRLAESVEPLLTNGVRTNVRKPAWAHYDVKEN